VEAIPVYRDQRSIVTFRKSLQTLQEGKDLVIFAESPVSFSNFVNKLDNGFADIGKFYYKTYKKTLTFYPVYICAAQRCILVGEGRPFDPALTAGENRALIADAMQQGIDALARTLPPHKPIHYRG